MYSVLPANMTPQNILYLIFNGNLIIWSFNHGNVIIHQLFRYREAILKSFATDTKTANLHKKNH